MPQGLGPVEYLIVLFQGKQSCGDIVPALMNLLDQGLIRIIDLAVVSKDRVGKVTILESGDLQADVAEALYKLECELSNAHCDDGLIMTAMELEHHSAEATMLLENVWAAQLAAAVRKAEGDVLLNVRLPGNATSAGRSAFFASRYIDPSHQID